MWITSARHFTGTSQNKQLTEFTYEVMGYKERSYDQIPHTGLSADYVYRETKRALEGVAGTNTQIWPGIDIDIPTEVNHSKSTPQSVKDAVASGIQGGRARCDSLPQIFGDAPR